MIAALILALWGGSATPNVPVPTPVPAVAADPRICTADNHALVYRDYDHSYVALGRDCSPGEFPVEPYGGAVRCFNGLQEAYSANDHRWNSTFSSCTPPPAAVVPDTPPGHDPPRGLPPLPS